MSKGSGIRTRVKFRSERMGLSSRNDDEGVLEPNTSRRSDEEIRALFRFPSGGRILFSFFVARRLCILRIHFTPRASNLNKIRSAKLILVRIPLPTPPSFKFDIPSQFYYNERRVETNRTMVRIRENIKKMSPYSPPL